MRYLVIPNKKEKYGPIMASIVRTGIEIKTPEEVKPEDEVLIFHNQPLVVNAKKTGWWMCDLKNPKLLANGCKFDYVFLCNKKYLKEYKEVFCKIGGEAIYVPQCGDDNPILKESFWDVVFIGNFTSDYHKNRFRILKKIGEKFNLKLVSGKDYSPENKYLYRDTPISLAISPQVEGYTSNRLYNILSCGGFCLTLYFEGIEKLFEKGKHLDWFHTPEEANELIKYYLEHSKERKKIAKAGQELYYKKHSAEERLNFMLSTFDKLKN